MNEDSLRIENLLQQAEREDCGGEHPMTYFARQFLGTPYVAHTLEGNDPEQLVVNTRQLDCSTFVETVAALTLCHRSGTRRYRHFCQRLQQIRYRQGRIDGYPSRLHYLTEWALDNQQKGLLTSVLDTVPSPLLKDVSVNVNYMSTHPDRYAALKQHPEYIPHIRRNEAAINGLRVRVLPKAYTNRSPRQLPFIQTGDIVAIVTSKAGLDTSHLGIALWQDGKLHLIHASSLRKQVILDPQTFHQYTSRQPSQSAIRILRLKE